MVRMSLQVATAKKIFGAQLPNNMRIDKFWCFTLQFAYFTLRMMYNKKSQNTLHATPWNQTTSV